MAQLGLVRHERAWGGAGAYGQADVRLKHRLIVRLPLTLQLRLIALVTGLRLIGLGLGLGFGLGVGLGLEEVFVFDSKSENMDRAVEAVEAVSEARAV